MKPVEIQDLFRLRFPSTPALSPDGAHCAFLVHTAQQRENRYQSDIWIAAPDGSGSRIWVCGAAPRLLLWLDEQTLLFAEVQNGQTVCSTAVLPNGKPEHAFTLPRACTGLWRMGDGVFLAQAVLPAESEERIQVLEEIPFWSNGHGFTSGQRSALFLYRAAQNVWEPVGPQTGEIGIVSVSGARVYYSIRYRLNRKMKFAAVRRFDLKTGTEEEIVCPDRYDVFWVGELQGQVLLYATDMKRYGNVENPCFYAVQKAEPVLLADYDEGPTNDVTSDARYGTSAQYAVDGGWLYYIITQNGCSQLARVNAGGRREILTSD